MAMSGQHHHRFEQRDPRDLGDLLRRLDSLVDSKENRPPPALVAPAPPPPTPAPISVNFFEQLNVKVGTLLTVAAVMVSTGIGIGAWMNSTKGTTDKFEVAMEAVRKDIRGLSDRIDRQSEVWYERMAFVFTDFCRRTERENTGWRCADPITMPMDPAAGKRVRSGGE
jgi:hypothetical protein